MASMTWTAEGASPWHEVCPNPTSTDFPREQSALESRRSRSRLSLMPKPRTHCIVSCAYSRNVVTGCLHPVGQLPLEPILRTICARVARSR